jgi:hypothetical protein
LEGTALDLAHHDLLGLVTIGMAFTNYAIVEAEIARHSQGSCGKGVGGGERQGVFYHVWDPALAGVVAIKPVSEDTIPDEIARPSSMGKPGLSRRFSNFSAQPRYF